MNELPNNDDNQKKRTLIPERKRSYIPERKRPYRPEYKRPYRPGYKTLRIMPLIIVNITAIMIFWQGNAIIEFNLSDNPGSTPGYESDVPGYETTVPGYETNAPGGNIISGEKEDIHSIVLKYNKLFQNNVVTNWQSYEINDNIPYSLTNAPFERGISISQYNSFDQSIDWKSVKADGIDYAIIRIGGRGYETGNIYVDTNFFDHIEGAQKNGIKIGCYFYSQAITREEVDEEIVKIVETIGQYKDSLDYPIGVSLDRRVRTADLSDTECVDIVKYFCIRLLQAGYTPMIMGNLEWFEQFEEETFKGYLKLVSTERPPSGSIDNCIIWEYDESAERIVDGIGSQLELSISEYGLLE